jgi:hypothetical protein
MTVFAPPFESAGKSYAGITDKDISVPPTFEEKLRIFECSVLGWQLEMAERIVNGKGDDKRIVDSGYAVLSILVSYPEMIWQFDRGKSSKHKSQRAFREGMQLIFPKEVDLTDKKWEEVLDLVYTSVRCGMYHDARARKNVVLTGDLPAVMSVDLTRKVIQLNPHKLPAQFIRHFHDFVGQIRTASVCSRRAWLSRRLHRGLPPATHPPRQP